MFRYLPGISLWIIHSQFKLRMFKTKLLILISFSKSAFSLGFIMIDSNQTPRHHPYFSLFLPPYSIYQQVLLTLSTKYILIWSATFYLHFHFPHPGHYYHSPMFLHWLPCCHSLSTQNVLLVNCRFSSYFKLFSGFKLYFKQSKLFSGFSKMQCGLGPASSPSPQLRSWALLQVSEQIQIFTTSGLCEFLRLL